MWIFGTSSFTPHGFCLAWQPGLIWLDALSNLATGCAYLAISAGLASVLLRRKGSDYIMLAALFAAFILACAGAHLLDVVTLWVPAYWLAGAMDALTALLSIVTAAVLWPMIPHLVSIPSPAALHASNLRLRKAENATAEANRWLLMSEQLAHVGHWRQVGTEGAMNWSAELFNIFGVTATDDPVSNATVRKRCHPEDLGVIQQAAARALREGGGFDASARVIRPSGEIRHVRIRGEVQLGADGLVGSMFGICVDRTEQAEIELQLTLARSDAEAATSIVEKLALMDSLTGLANRRQFDRVMDCEFRRARRAQTSLALIMIDVDNFKLYNDARGHVAGDACLRAIAAAIAGLLRRPGDVAARYGGEEFVVILPDTSLTGARDIARHIVQAVRGLSLAHPSSAGAIVTVSAGVSVIAPATQEGNAQQLVESSDKALYRAKALGRDQAYAVALVLDR